jgi:hypothetical protein
MKTVNEKRLVKEGIFMNNNYRKVLGALADADVLNQFLKILDMEISMPNIPMPTMGGEVFWNTLASCNGYRLQQNMFTQHARILDSNNIRIAWGTINGMIKAMDRTADLLNRYGNDN